MRSFDNPPCVTCTCLNGTSHDTVHRGHSEPRRLPTWTPIPNVPQSSVSQPLPFQEYSEFLVIVIKGKKYLLFGGGFGRPMGVWMITQDEPSTLVIAGSILNQCAVMKSLVRIFILLGKVGSFSQSFPRRATND